MLPIRFGVDDVPVKRQIGTFSVSIQNDYRHLVYVGKPQPHQVPISYIGMPDTSPKNINIRDINETPGLVEIAENSYLVRFTRRNVNQMFDLPSKYALITNVTQMDGRGTPIPLFYKHVIPGGFSTQPEILDQNMSTVDSLHYKIVVSESEIAIFHDLEPEYDVASASVVAYYIRYTATDGTQVFRLLESEPGFREANIVDFPGGERRVYTVRKLSGKYRYRILHNGVGPYYIKLVPESQLKLHKPLLARSTEPWYLSVSNGEITTIVNGNKEHYFIPEYHFQAFTPVEPIQYTGTQECAVLSGHIVATPFKHLIDNSEYHIQLLVTDEMLNPKFGYTTAPNSPRTFWVDRMGRWREQAELVRFPLNTPDPNELSFSKHAGLIHLEKQLLTTDRVFIRGYREVRDFTYLSLNLNPLHNRHLLKGRAVVYALPESEMPAFQVGIHHIILDEDDNIVAWSDSRLGETELTPTLVPDEDDETGYSLFKEQHPNYLILGSITITREASAIDLTYIDVRQEGNKLTEKVEENLPKFLDEYPELQWISDNKLSGRSVPLHGAFIVDAPFRLLKEGGGSFTKEDVTALVSRHMALGSYPVIRYYAEKPQIVGVSFDSETNTLEVIWTDNVECDSYRVYLSGSKNKGFINIDVDGEESDYINSLTAEVPLNQLPIEGTGKIYVYIAPVKDGYEWPASDLVEIDLERISGVVHTALSAVIESAPTLTVSLSAIIGEE